ncbi:hypothetical protein TNCV_1538311 [Trichonephila clavipes]|nr:hypothetical protein TNCV_1538311 [Trichonephila clavipes]
MIMRFVNCDQGDGRPLDPNYFSQFVFRRRKRLTAYLRLMVMVEMKLRGCPTNSPAVCVVPARICSQSSRHCWRSPLPHASALIQRDFGCVLGVQQTKQLPHVDKGDLVRQLGV